jgi:type II secretion system protein C
VSRRLPFLILSLLTVFAAGSAWGANALLAHYIAAPGPVPESEAVATVGGRSGAPPPVERALTGDQYLDGIMGRNLFDVAMIDLWAARRPTAAGDDLAPSQLKVKLLGTMVADPQQYSSALIADESTPDLPSSYSIGDMIQDREVVSIANTQVGLKGPDGKIEYLLLEGGELTPTVAATDGEPTAEGEGVDQIGENKFSVSKDVFDKYINDLEGISRMGRALLHRGPDGEFDGYRLSAIRRNTLADQLGIKNGDIIHAVNGQSLNSVQSAMNAYNTLRTDSSFCFEISRRGSPTELCYEVH